MFASLMPSHKHGAIRRFHAVWFSPTDIAQIRDRCVYGNPVSSAQALNCACTLARSPLDLTSSAMSRPASRRQATTSCEVTNPSQPTKRRNICPVLPPSRLPRFESRSSRPISSEEGHVARNLPKLPCSPAIACTKAALSRTDRIFAPLRTMRVSPIRRSQNSSGWKVSLAGAKPRNASSKPGHFVSITRQAKPAENTRMLISVRIRSSESLASAFAFGFFGSNFSSAFAPPLRFSARARMALNEMPVALVAALSVEVLPVEALSVEALPIAAPGLFQRRQQSCHQPAALGEAFDDDVFVEGMRIGAAHAETIEGGDAYRASKIAIRAAAGGGMRQFHTELLGQIARLFVQRHGAGIRLPHRPCHAAGDREGHVVLGT